MLIKIGDSIYETDFSLQDLSTFYNYGLGSSIAEKIIDGARYFWFNRSNSKEKIAGSLKAIVEVFPTPFVVPRVNTIVENNKRELPF